MEIGDLQIFYSPYEQDVCRTTYYYYYYYCHCTFSLIHLLLVPGDEFDSEGFLNDL